LHPYKTSTSLNDIIDIERRKDIADEVMESVLRVIRKEKVRVRGDYVSELILEIVDNFYRHAGNKLAAFTMQYFPNIKQVTLSIGDYRIGISESLSSNPKYADYAHRPHYEAALKAFEPYVTSGTEGGTGLTNVQDLVLALNGILFLATGNGYVRISNRETKYGPMAYDLPGVQVYVWIPGE